MASLSDTTAQLSQTYWGACDRMQIACTQLYELLHTKEGEPRTDIEQVYDKVSEARKWILIEADLIREAVRQHNEEGGRIS